ncbi:MAG: hypothetical protein LBT83_08555 [Tannerella sp.]|jgi:hypothetical protein|nr:hypothetical protein [Tannerella sp.]
MEKQSHKKKNKRRFSLLYILSGGVLKEEFVTRHTRMIGLVVVLMAIYIGNQYGCLAKLREIDRLQQELRQAKYESISISSQLTGNNRQSQIEDLIKSQGLELGNAKTPPYILHK